MGIKFNPIGFSGLDFVGGGSAGPAQRDDVTFDATTSWVLNGSNYELSIPALSHGRGDNPTVTVLEEVSGNFEVVQAVIIVSPTGDVTVQVSSTPDTRFAGKVILI